MSNTTVRNRGNTVAFFALTFAFSWGLAALLVLFPSQIEALFGKPSAAHPLFILAVAGPTIVATAQTFAHEGAAGLRSLYARMARWRFGLHWYALLLIGIPLIAYLVSQIAGPQLKFDLSTPGLLAAFLLLNLILGPLGEELGWRGYALPRLLQRFNPLTASLIVGALWAVWHLPAFFVSGLPQASLAIPAFLFGTLCLSILATWIFLHTGGSVLSTVLFHWTVNCAQDLFGAPQLPFTLALALAAALVLLFDRRLGWFGNGPAQGADQPLVATEVI
ncbi:MAG TPA: type II CAAX endopeptidase family protein [Roseiflexaceae bacterium]|nr:type II CAAX endopeptidase family protein [Roseiflexaceae bacterium]